MFAKLTTKIALRKAGIPSNALSFPDSNMLGGSNSNSKDGNSGGPFKGAAEAWQVRLTCPFLILFLDIWMGELDRGLMCFVL